MSNKLDKDYQALLQDILDNGVQKKDRTGTGTTSVFGRQIRHKMSEGFPLLTTKKMPWKTIVTELLWFLRGDTNIKYLVDNGCYIWNGDAWKNYQHKASKQDFLKDGVLRYDGFILQIQTNDEFANKWGELGPIYGKQWRQYRNITPHKYLPSVYNETYIDQIQNLINDLKTNPDSRRLMVNAWNVGELDQMVLPPCHYGFQVYTRELSFDEFWDRLTPKQRGTFEKPYEGETYNGIDSRLELKNIVSEIHNLPTRAISLMWNQRSVDTFLGLPFNIASYGLLLEIIAKQVNMVPDELIGNLGDVHLYSNHLDAAKEQIGRELTLDERKQIFEDRGYVCDVWPFNGDWSGEYDGFAIPKRTRQPFPLPTLKINPNNEMRIGGGIFTYDRVDFEVENYQSHPTIKATLSN